MKNAIAETEALDLISRELTKLLNGYDTDPKEDGLMPCSEVRHIRNVCDAQAEMIRIGIADAQMRDEA